MKSILREARPDLTIAKLDEECYLAWSMIVVIDRSILVAKDKDKYIEELETFCNDVGIPYKYYHILPMILIGNQAKISKKHNNKPMMMTTFVSFSIITADNQFLNSTAASFIFLLGSLKLRSP